LLTTSSSNGTISSIASASSNNCCGWPISIQLKLAHRRAALLGAHRSLIHAQLDLRALHCSMRLERENR